MGILVNKHTQLPIAPFSITFLYICKLYLNNTILEINHRQFYKVKIYYEYIFKYEIISDTLHEYRS